MSPVRLLLVEDEDPKRRHIVSFLATLIPDADVSMAKSVRSAIESLQTAIPDLIILDMSLPTFDVGADEAGGRPQGFGGIELLRNMELEEIVCPVVVVTGYDSFEKAGGQVGLDALNREMSETHPQTFKGMLHFNSAYGDWQKKLKQMCVELGIVRQ